MLNTSLKVYYFVLLFLDEVVSKYLQYVIKDFNKSYIILKPMNHDVMTVISSNINSFICTQT